MYRIPESAVLTILQGKVLGLGVHEITERIEGFQHPLRIVVAVEDDVVTVITNYPLKKGRSS